MLLRPRPSACKGCASTVLPPRPTRRPWPACGSRSPRLRRGGLASRAGSSGSTCLSLGARGHQRSGALPASRRWPDTAAIRGSRQTSGVAPIGRERGGPRERLSKAGRILNLRGSDQGLLQQTARPQQIALRSNSCPRRGERRKAASAGDQADPPRPRRGGGVLAEPDQARQKSLKAGCALEGAMSDRRYRLKPLWDVAPRPARTPRSRSSTRLRSASGSALRQGGRRSRCEPVPRGSCQPLEARRRRRTGRTGRTVVATSRPGTRGVEPSAKLARRLHRDLARRELRAATSFS